MDRHTQPNYHLISASGIPIVDAGSYFTGTTVEAALQELGAGGGGGGHTIEDEGTPLTQRTNLNFVGADVAVTDDAGNDATVVTITPGGSYTDEQAQDAVGTILTDSPEIDFTYNDGVPSISASIVSGSIDETKLDVSTNASLDLADSSVQPNDPITDLNGTAHRVFYSDGSGNITELALGADGTFLKSNGAAAAPSFATPAGSGDVSKVGTPVNNQIGVWTGDGTLEGDAALTFDTATNTLATDIVTVTDEAYDATAWNASLEVPTKNAIRDKIESMSVGSGIAEELAIAYAVSL